MPQAEAVVFAPNPGFSFSLDDEQLVKSREWLATLPDGPTGASGGRITYEFTPTTIGLVVVLRDNLTEQKIDLTDYDSW